MTPEQEARFASRLSSIAKQVRAIHHYGDPPDPQLAGRVDSDVEDILDLVYGIVEDMERERSCATLPNGECEERGPCLHSVPAAERESRLDDIVRNAEAAWKVGGPKHPAVYDREYLLALIEAERDASFTRIAALEKDATLGAALREHWPAIKELLQVEAEVTVETGKYDRALNALAPLMQEGK